MKKLYKINEKDNVSVALTKLKQGEEIDGIVLKNNIPFGHKVALSYIKKGENVIKYGYPIGSAKSDIKIGEHIHSHNLQTNLSSKIEYTYNNENNTYSPINSDLTFKGYKRKNGKVGIRNEIWVIPTVGCVNKTAEKLAEIGNKTVCENCDGVFAYTHPYGCSQLGDDQISTKKILASLVNHPNAGGVLVVSLGCENNNLDVFKTALGDFDETRVKFLTAQNETDELEKGKELIEKICESLKNDKREDLPLSSLTVGFKCGGSDAFSGITANPLCGMLTDYLTSFGAKVILTETPEMFGAETILMNRAQDKEVFDKTVNLVNDFKDYFISHNQVVYENPSPGNKAGGITTLEEKSLGCIQKGGSAIVTDVLKYGESCKKNGLSLLSGPGNDIVSTTNLTASGANIILFTTGRGTPLGAPVPTIKISTNNSLYEKKKNWIDYNAGELLNSKSKDDALDELVSLLISVANGQKTKNEINGYKEIAIFKDGVTL